MPFEITLLSCFGSGSRFSKAPETFRAHKAFFRSSEFKNGEVYTPETSGMKSTSLHTKNMWIKTLCNRKVRDFALALRARKVSRAFEKRDPGAIHTVKNGGLYRPTFLYVWAIALKFT